MTEQTLQNAAAKDQAAYEEIREKKYQDQLIYASHKSGRSILQIQKDFSRLARSITKLNLTEYLLHGFHYEGNYSDEERLQFIGNKIHWPIANTCNDHTWNATTEDKALACTLLTAGGLPVPENLGVIDKSQRVFPGINKVNTPDALRALCIEHADAGLFGKVIGGMVGFGVFRIQSATNHSLVCSGIGEVSYEDFLDRVVGENSYLIQRQLRNHSRIAPFASALATVRMVNLVSDEGVYVPMAAMALAQGSNIADAFWRDGNIACAVDVDTGRLTTVAQRDDQEIRYLEDHPKQVGLKGLSLPYWNELKEINARAARLFAPIRYQSTDIAITDTGPVIVEINYGCGFGLPQQASGKGLLTPEVRAFFESCGYDFEAKPRRRFRFFGR